MKIYLICGEAGAGKSTFVRTMSNCGFATFHSGAVFKKMKDSIKIDDMESPIELDSYVRDSMFRFLRTFASQDAVFIESVPRSLDSLKWVENLIHNYGRQNIFVIWFRMDKQKRIERMMNREGNRKEFDLKRFESEDCEKHAKLIYGLGNIIAEGHLIIHDGSDELFSLVNRIRKEVRERFDPLCNSIQERYISAVNGYYEKCGYVNERPNFDRMVERVKEELDELSEAFNSDNKKYDDVKSEFADVMHFLYCLADAAGITPEDMNFEFWKKTRINQARLQFNAGKDIKHKLNGNLIGNIFKKDN